MPLPIVTNMLGDSRKRRWLEESELVPILHTCLLNGDQLTCCCSRPIQTNYYQFDVRSLRSGKSTHVAYAGDGCADRLLKLSAEMARPITPLRLFSPFAAPARERQGGNGAENLHGGEMPAWAPLNRELNDALSLFALIWRVTPGKVLLDVRARIEADPATPYVPGALSVNTIIRKFGGDRRTLTDRLNALRADNPGLRQFPFPHLRRVLAERPEADGTLRTVYL